MTLSQDRAEGLTRRGFLTGGRAAPSPAPVMRPPWTDPERIAAHCVGCEACGPACPEDIIRFSTDTRGPFIVLNGAECTFCGACVDACPEPVFQDRAATPWPVTAMVTDGCLNTMGISCQLCRDICPTQAISVDLSIRPVGAVVLDAESCTGCGACLPTCPQTAITLIDPRQEAQAHG